jgi:hypothetical protein
MRRFRLWSMVALAGAMAMGLVNRAGLWVSFRNLPDLPGIHPRSRKTFTPSRTGGRSSPDRVWEGTLRFAGMWLCVIVR